MMEHLVLDLGLVLYSKVIERPQEVIDLVEDLDRRFMAKEHGERDTIVDGWKAKTANDVLHNRQKIFPDSKEVPDNDYYAKEMKEIADRLYPSLETALDHYRNTIYPFAAKTVKVREKAMHLLRYGKGGSLHPHEDQGPSTRVLSSIIYLNDDYDGGEIEFINSGIKIKPEAGSIIFFPSNFLYVHQVHQIANGFRYSMPIWYHNSINRR